MEPGANGRLNCSRCHHKSMVIYRWEDNSPLGVCHNCMAARELTVEELNMIINKRICDRPGCGADVPEDGGIRLNMTLSPIVEKEHNSNIESGVGDGFGALSADAKACLETSWTYEHTDDIDAPETGEPTIGVKWDLCPECVDFFSKIFNGSEGNIVGKLIKSMKQYGPRKKPKADTDENAIKIA